MRITIKEDSEILPLSVFNIEDWFCKKEDIKAREATIEHETEKAYLFNVGEEQQWIPKSVCKEVKTETANLAQF